MKRIAMAVALLVCAAPAGACERHYLTGFYTRSAMQVDGERRVNFDSTLDWWEAGDVLLSCGKDWINLSFKQRQEAHEAVLLPFLLGLNHD